MNPDDNLVSENNSHSHPPNPLQVVVSKAVDCMKERASTESTPLPTVYRETMVAMSQTGCLFSSNLYNVALKKQYCMIMGKYSVEYIIQQVIKTFQRNEQLIL